jgi:hypothetical protein
MILCDAESAVRAAMGGADRIVSLVGRLILASHNEGNRSPHRHPFLMVIGLLCGHRTKETSERAHDKRTAEPAKFS